MSAAAMTDRGAPSAPTESFYDQAEAKARRLMAGATADGGGESLSPSQQRFQTFMEQRPQDGPAEERYRMPPEETPWITATDLMARVFPPIVWTIPEYLPQGATFLAGRPKLGKSWLALDWAIAVASGGETMGVQCDQGDVLYAALEDTERRLQGRIKIITRGGICPPRLSFLTKMPRADEGGLDLVRRWLSQAARPRLVIIDVLQHVRQAKAKEEGNYDSDYSAVSVWKKLADDFNIALVLIHHVRKSEAADPLEMISGTNGLTGAADTTIILKRDAQGDTIYGRGRDVEEYDKAIKFDRTSCRWDALGDAKEVRRSDERGAILDALEAQSDPMSSREISDATGHDYGATRTLIHKMVRDGEICKASRGRYAAYPRNIGNKITTDDADPFLDPFGGDR